MIMALVINKKHFNININKRMSGKSLEVTDNKPNLGIVLCSTLIANKQC